MNESVLIIGGGKVERLVGERGETPACPDAKFQRGAVVKIRNRKALSEFPKEAVVAVAVPPGFSADHALADLVGEPRPFMCRAPERGITYILVRENDPKPYLVKERDLLPSGKEPVEIGSCRREGAAESVT